ncbi:universal stress protein [Halobacteriaceae archaeon GCM10025711]
MIGEVLIPTDGSKGAHRGMEHGLDIAERYGACVHVLFVVDERRFGPLCAFGSDELAIEQVEETGESLVSEVAAAAEERGLDVVASVRRGVPCEVILAYSEEHDVDLIVIGKHGISGRKPVHVGSTTDRVIRSSEVPVLPA